MAIAVKDKVTFIQPNPFGIAAHLVFTVKVLTPSKFKRGQIRALVVCPAGAETWTDVVHLSATWESRMQQDAPATPPAAAQKRDLPQTPAPSTRAAAMVETQRSAPLSVSVFGDAPELMTDAVYPAARRFGFAGFSSLSALVAHLRGVHWNDIWDKHAWENGKAGFNGTASLDEAFDLATGVWSEGVALASRVVDAVRAANPSRLKVTHGMAGGSVNIGRMLAGDPLHMRRRAPAPSTRNITLYANMASSASIPQEFISIRAAVVSAIADRLEASGYSVEIMACSAFTKDGNTHGAAVRLKAAGDALSLSNVVFGMGHASMLRRFVFGLIGSDVNVRGIGKQFGFPSAVKMTRPDAFALSPLMGTAHQNIPGGETGRINYAMQGVLSDLRTQGLEIEMDEVTA